MPDQTANLALPLILGSQAQKHVTHNEALQRLDTLVQLAVISRSVSEPPTGPSEGARYLVPAGALGAWAGHDGALAIFSTGAWQFLSPREGWRAFVLDEAVELVFAAGAWDVPPLPELSQLDGVGIMTGYDAVNRFSVAAEATLLSHAGAGHQLKLNKAAAAETASLLFQSNWSGRAEMGLAGSDDFAIKASADGATWFEGLRIDAATGRATMSQGAVIDGALTGSGVVGTVAQVGGVSTGAVIEQGSTASGDYIRFADGTQICSAQLSLSYVADWALKEDWAYPAQFAQAPCLSVALDADSLAAGSAISAGALSFAGVEAVTSSGARAVVYAANGASFLSGESCDLSVTAIGRWV
ncbi:hypothetical protein DEM26_02850 [Thioclava sp. NG1]|uniref:DUF2793 domain-containing protein n=1 Tax=Thioclava sp. NG1 TaxID=2182426 RepID=UPI000D621C60|nr:DUF2793 domain-containing protein [Thioclava sp. NG1]PWE51911.1 hypothetical protein DEM26_02850 [Thioclava sp. NG1]